MSSNRKCKLRFAPDAFAAVHDIFVVRSKNEQFGRPSDDTNLEYLSNSSYTVILPLGERRTFAFPNCEFT